MSRRSRARDRARLTERVAALEEAVTLADGRLDPAAVDGARQVAELAHERLARSAASLVVALAGGTGSGKSSLFNALAGEELARTGVRRPITSEVTAWAVRPDEETADLLDWLDVASRHEADGPRTLDGLVLLDLPDHDSVVAAHRATADRAVDRADVLLWVLDPLKYAQRASHDDYLRRLVGHEGVLEVVLNRADELAPSDVEPVVEDLRRLLASEGLGEVAVHATSAATGAGVEELRRRLAGRVKRQRDLLDRLGADVASAAATLAPATAASGGHVDRARVDAALARAADVEGRAAAVRERYRRAALAASRSALTRRWWPGRPAIPALGAGAGPQLERTTSERTASERADATPPRTVLLAAGGEASLRRELAEAAGEAAHGLPQPWPALLAARSDVVAADLLERLPRALAAAGTVDATPGRAWHVLSVLRTAGLVTALVGLVWLGVLAGLAFLQLPAPEPPTVADALPAPTALVAGGIAFAVLIALLTRALVALAARRRARRSRRRLAGVLDEVATSALGPLTEERDAHDRLRAALDRAAG